MPISCRAVPKHLRLKLGRQYFLEIGQPQRTRFISRRQSYHGNTLGALAASGNMARREPYLPLLAGAFSHVSPAFSYRFKRDQETDSAYVQRLADELEAEFQRLGPDTVAAFCAETVVGATAGAVTAPAGYFSAVRAVCDRHGALLILDEVMCGMGRTGTMHAWEQEGVGPDIQMIAKGLGGGYQPIGGLLIHGRIISALESGSRAFTHGHTYLAHPVVAPPHWRYSRRSPKRTLLRMSGRSASACDSFFANALAITRMSATFAVEGFYRR